jgi:hypothetical protein
MGTNDGYVMLGDFLVFIILHWLAIALHTQRLSAEEEKNKLLPFKKKEVQKERTIWQEQHKNTLWKAMTNSKRAG